MVDKSISDVSIEDVMIKDVKYLSSKATIGEVIYLQLYQKDFER